MKKLLSAGAVVCLMVVAVLIAGCTTTTTNNTTMTTTQDTQPTTATARATNVSQYLTASMQDRGFTMVTPFSRQATLQNGTVRTMSLGGILNASVMRRTTCLTLFRMLRHDIKT